MKARSAKGRILLANWVDAHSVELHSSMLDIVDRSVAIQELIMSVWGKLQ